MWDLSIGVQLERPEVDYVTLALIRSVRRISHDWAPRSSLAPSRGHDHCTAKTSNRNILGALLEDSMDWEMVL